LGNLPDITEADLAEFIKFWLQGSASILFMLISGEILIRAGAWWVHRKDETPRTLVSKDAPANFVLFIISILIEGVAGTAAIAAGLKLGSEVSHWHIPFTIWTIPVYFLAAEFWHYIYHRMSHEIRVLWADHSIHHSSRDYEFFTSWRITPFTWAYKALTVMPLAMLGFGVVPFLLMSQFISFQTFIHTRRIGSLGWFDSVFCSPVNHGIHHACNPQYIDKNYGGMTVIWDQLLGTFMLPRTEKIKFGITRDVNSHDPFKILSFEFRHLFVDLWHAPGLAAKAQVLFGKPGETYSHSGKGREVGDSAGGAILVAAE
jgi:sterol desaturase/sphingolipid hydroxylase (fatty acid hydroxylase superfamily)